MLALSEVTSVPTQLSASRVQISQLKEEHLTLGFRLKPGEYGSGNPFTHAGNLGRRCTRYSSSVNSGMIRSYILGVVMLALLFIHFLSDPQG